MTSLAIATTEDLDALLPMVSAFHADEQIDLSLEQTRASLLPLLEGSPYGVVYLAGPRRAPIGYLIATFSWSVRHGGMHGYIDQIFVRPKIRKRGIASSMLVALPKALKTVGINALHIEISDTAPETIRFYERLNFQARDGYRIMSLVF